jgi:hypothetical protein
MPRTIARSSWGSSEPKPNGRAWPSVSNIRGRSSGRPKHSPPSRMSLAGSPSPTFIRATDAPAPLPAASTP